MHFILLMKVIIRKILKRNFFILLLSLIIIFCFKFSVLNLPSSWDEAAIIELGWDVYKNNLNPFVGGNGYHPPLVHTGLAILYKIYFGLVQIILKEEIFMVYLRHEEVLIILILY